jgi:hypothetical protein
MNGTEDVPSTRKFYGLCSIDGVVNVPAMSANHQVPDVRRPWSKTAWLRVAGVAVLLLGLTTAGAVYWIRTHPGPTEDELLAGNARAESREMGILYGKMGVLMHELSEDLKQPGTQACLIAATSILVALGCFHVARLSDEEDQAR